MVRKDLGMVTAYAYAVSKGYTGTEEEFAELMASYATVAESANASAQAAAGSASAAAGSATNASGSASAAAGSASAAASSASTASTKASESATSATAAAGSATTASTKAGESASSASAAAQSATQAAGSASAAAQSATDANTAKTDAQTAKTAAETAQEKAEEAQAAAEAAAQTLVIDDTLTQENQAAEAKTVGDALKTKAEIDGYYQDMTVGDAEQLVSTQYVEDNVPYKFRTSGGSADVGNREYVDKIVGGTIAWNQLARTPIKTLYYTVSEDTTNYDFTLANNADLPLKTGHKYLLGCKITRTISGNNELSITMWSVSPIVSVASAKAVNGVANGFYATIANSSVDVSTVRFSLNNYSGKKGFSAGDTVTFDNIMVFDLTQMFGSAVADAVYAMEQATAGAGVAWFRSMFPDDYYDYNAGELISVSGLQSHDMVGFNILDGEWESGSITSEAGIDIVNATTVRTVNYLPVLPQTVYCFTLPDNNMVRIRYYDANKKYISPFDVNASTANGYLFTTPENAHFIRIYVDKEKSITNACINLSWSGTRNGEYEPYEKHSYPLDSSLTLRGIPKLSADNQLYFDGDEYLPEGKVNRRFGIVDLGTLTWSKGEFNGNVRFNSTVENSGYSGSGVFYGVFSNKYMTHQDPIGANNRDKVGIGYIASGRLLYYFRDSAYDNMTAEEVKTALSGSMLVYELATPTEEIAEAYQAIQLVDDWGTEEYVSGTICPVGHETRYPADLVKKLEGLPWNFATLIAPTEATTTASRAYTVGSYLILNNTLYKVTSAIANGATITPGTNATATTIMDELMAMA